jgi:hypothetical protein
MLSIKKFKKLYNIPDEQVKQFGISVIEASQLRQSKQLKPLKTKVFQINPIYNQTNY